MPTQNCIIDENVDIQVERNLIEMASFSVSTMLCSENEQKMLYIDLHFHTNEFQFPFDRNTNDNTKAASDDDAQVDSAYDTDNNGVLTW